LIKFVDVTKTYESSTIIRKANFEVGRGEMIFISGPSGSGKTTLLKMIFLEERPDDGQIFLDDKNLTTLPSAHIAHLRRMVGVVFQDFRLLPMSVYDNVALTLRIRGMSERHIRPIVNDTLKLAGLRHKAESFASSLSGGEQQRVSIARAIVGEPQVLLADEPTGNLDPDTAAGIRKLFREINMHGTTVVFATHSRELFRDLGNRVLRLEDGVIMQEAGL
jgi:cell division transport system ATP-binding protein